ncbi:MAG: Gfo/Idh/MocA family protein [Campylobacter sp.]
MLKFAIIGMGVMGKNHLNALQNGDTGAKVEAVCDVVAQDEFGCAFYNDLDNMLDNVSLDAAIIATPTFLHHQIAMKCIQKGLNLLIEKPVAMDLKQVDEIEFASKKLGVKVAVGHVERLNSAVLALKNELKDKKIYQINTTRISPFPARIADVGVLADLGVHDIDLIRFISEREIIDFNAIKTQKIHSKCEDDAILNFKLNDDITASSHVSWLYPFRKRSIEVVCDDGVFQADLMAQELKFYGKMDNSCFYQKLCFVKKGEALVAELKEFVKFLKDMPNKMANLNDGRETLKFII